ncbi:MAG: hypothetical protein LQ340_001950 [Diploschistes diacapsis]|nr:MAG: hypothetical protein LQ340_001950 [Diploschistes diacapsis]
MTVALRTPKLVRALIPVDNAPADAVLKSDFARYVQGMKRIVEAGVTKQAEADDILKPYENQLAIRQFILTNLVRDQDSRTLKFRIPVQILAGALDNMGDFPFKDPDLARYDGRTLVIRGSKSHYVPDEMIPLIGRFFPLFEIRDIDSGHWVISEQPEAFRQAVVEYLRAKD